MLERIVVYPILIISASTTLAAFFSAIMDNVVFYMTSIMISLQDYCLHMQNFFN